MPYDPAGEAVHTIAPAAGGEQRTGAVLRGQEDAGQVHVERPLPDRRVEPVGAVVLPDELRCGVRDHHVEAAELLDRASNGVLERRSRR